MDLPLFILTHKPIFEELRRFSILDFRNGERTVINYLTLNAW
jgi:hypothetical protein